MLGWLAVGLVACGTAASEQSGGAGGANGENGGGGAGAGANGEVPGAPPGTGVGDPKLAKTGVVFVSRTIPPEGSLYLKVAKAMPGVGPFSRSMSAGPGKLVVRDEDGTVRVLVDGANPTSATLNLADVNAPDVSYDGTKIVFAGLEAGHTTSGLRPNPGAWRIYTINTNGTGLARLTAMDGPGKYDDVDPVWLPDGRIVLASTRLPGIAQYVDTSVTNLFVVNADGTGIHRITAERNSAERPVIDPQTGRIVFFRWWRQMRNATDSMSTIANPNFPEGYAVKDGLVAENMSDTYGSVPGTERNAWQIVSVNPDGTGLQQFGGVSGVAYKSFDNHAYGGSFAPDGALYANFFPLHHLADQGGFGGVRRYPRGPHGYTPVIGVTTDGELVQQNPPSYNVYKGPYAADAVFLPNGRILVSWAGDTDQDYGLYVADADGSNRTLYYDTKGLTELRARAVVPRTKPPVIADTVTKIASTSLPGENPPYDIDGTFVFDALNVYANAPVDVDIVNAIPVGSGGTIRFFIDHYRGGGSNNHLHWPVVLEEKPINADGSVQGNAPANVSLFEQIRTPQAAGYKVALSAGTYVGEPAPAAHVSGHNWGRTGGRARCVGCHAGHTMIDVPANDDEARWSNLAPGAKVTTTGADGRGLIDRKVMTGNGDSRYWRAGANASADLTFAVPVSVRKVRLYGIPNGGTVQGATVTLLSGTTQVAQATSGAVAVAGTDVVFPTPVRAQTVRVRIDQATGSGGLGEVEVIAKGVP